MAMPAARDEDRLWNVYVRDGGCCTYCGQALKPDEVVLDHDQAHAQTERVAVELLSCACGDCRTDKGGRTAAEYRSLRRMRHARQMLAGLGSGGL